MVYIKGGVMKSTSKVHVEIRQQLIWDVARIRAVCGKLESVLSALQEECTELEWLGEDSRWDA
jgi:predicted N-formylglutamate amidohydrolase